MFKKICALLALILLALFLGPASAAVAPGEPNLITTVVIVAPADGKSEKKHSTAHLGYFCIGDKGPPADSRDVAYSQKNVFATSDTSLEAAHCTTEKTAGHNTGIMNDCCLRQIGDAPFAGIPGRP